MGETARKQIGFAAAVLAAAFLTHQIIYNLSFLKSTVEPEIYLIRTALALGGYFFVIFAGWYSLRVMGGMIFTLFAAVMVFFVGSVSSSSAFVWFLLEYAAVLYLLYRTDAVYENVIAGIEVDREKFQNDKNDLEIAHKAKGEGISILFEKYSTYYNLRKLAEELASSLSVGQLAQIIVRHISEFIPRGDVALLGLSDGKSERLTLAAYKPILKNSDWEPSRYQGADLFDQWVIKNQRRLIVADAHQDFRFDVTETARRQDVRSLIVAPVFHERRVVGTLRINASSPEALSNDDLRLLDTIAVLASSALSNAMLYERTEELAIKDSLTQLYVRRYFFERLKEEHRRALLTHRPLSLLMCDLDHFKDCNDKYGHGVGDLMLIEFSLILKRVAENAVIGRYGGEEFSILLPEASKEEAAALAEQIRDTVEKNVFTIRRERIRMTVSIGVANLPGDALDLEALVAKSDQALYKAKRSGRNRVCTSGD